MTVVNASVFPDILQKHSWAEEAIDDMVSRSILKGFPDGTFRPDNGITKLDALIIASRIAGVDLPENTDYAAAALKAHEKKTLKYMTLIIKMKLLIFCIKVFSQRTSFRHT